MINRFIIFSLSFSLVLSSNNTFAISYDKNLFDQKLSKLKEDLRPYVEEYLGDKWATKLLGRPSDRITLPPIPKIVNDATNLNSLEKDIFKDKTYQISAENLRRYNFQFVNELYQVALNRKATSAEQEKWINVLEQGAGREGIYRNIILSEEFQLLERNANLANLKCVYFASEMLKKYINLKIDDNQLKKMSHHTLKRIISEKALELMDIFTQSGQKGEDLFDWYAVLTGDWARNYPHAFNHSLQQNTELEVHRNWATQVPVDVLKAEMVIRLHRVINSLNAIKE